MIAPPIFLPLARFFLENVCSIKYFRYLCSVRKKKKNKPQKHTAMKKAFYISVIKVSNADSKDGVKVSYKIHGGRPAANEFAANCGGLGDLVDITTLRTIVESDHRLRPEEVEPLISTHLSDFVGVAQSRWWRGRLDWRATRRRFILSVQASVDFLMSKNGRA